MSGPKKKPALAPAMAAALGGATAKDVRSRSNKLAKKCEDLGVSPNAMVDVANEVDLLGLHPSAAMAQLEQLAGLLESISEAESRLPANKKAAAAKLKKNLLKSYSDSPSWIGTAGLYHMKLMNTLAEAHVATTPAPARTPWTTGTASQPANHQAGPPRTGPRLGQSRAPQSDSQGTP